MAFVAGQYTVTWNSVSVGQVKDGIRLRQTSAGEEIRGDTGGDSIQDWVHRGGDVFAQLVSLEYGAGSTAPFWPWETVLGRVGLPGVLASSKAKALVLTAVSGTTAATSPATLTGALACLPPGSSQELLFAPRLREVPLLFQLLPSVISSNNVWFTFT